MSVLIHMRPLRTVRPVRSITAVLAAVGAGVLLAGCASSATPGAASETPASTPAASEPAPSAPDTSAPENSAPGSSEAPGGDSELHDGPVWVSVAVTGQELVPDSEITIRQQGDRIGVTAGCNSMSGTLVDNGDSWEIGQLTSTMMGCSEELMAQDAWIGEFLEAGPTVARTAGQITLTSGDVSITLTERAPAQITDTMWELTGIISTDAVSSLPIEAEGAVLTIVDGQLQLAGICNGTGGDVTIEGDTLTVELGPSTLMSCGEEVDAAEQHARAVLGGTSTYVIDDQQLRIMKEDGTGLQFTATGQVLPDDMETMPTVTDAPESFPESPQTSGN